MRILIVHPVMAFLGGGERLCCETIRALLSSGHEITLLSEEFDPRAVERFFGYDELFDKVKLWLYSRGNKPEVLGDTSHLIHHLRGQQHLLERLGDSHKSAFDLMFSTQDPGYFPDTALPVVQWGYFPRYFPKFSQDSLFKAIRYLPVRLHYQQKISRIGLVLAISQYSKWHLDTQWNRPSVLVYPGCNMIEPKPKRNLIVTAARAIPQKRLELFWEVARLRPDYEFIMILTKDPNLPEYSLRLSELTPSNGKIIFNPAKEAYQDILGKAKVYVHLMENEHFGITIVESMSASCVPIVHDSGGPKEIVSEKIGFLWRNILEVPDMIDQAMKISPSSFASEKAHAFSSEIFGNRLSAIFSELQGRNPRSSL